MMFGLSDETVRLINGVLENHPLVEKAILYGSRAKGNFSKGSDIDLTLVGGEGLGLPVLYRVMEDIDELLLPYLFDLSLFHTIQDQELRGHIERVGKVFYQRAVQENAAE